jgi:medium-chain acyl-[acyl-carrier-protein] hydrolase
MLDDIWLPYRKPLAAPRARLFCFPHAGGSASLYRRWQGRLPADVELCAVQLPGREQRFRERARVNLRELADEIATAWKPTPVPFALLGVSMGGWISFELTRSLRRLGRPQPFHIFVGAMAAPHVPDTTNEHRMSLDQWIAYARQLGELTDQEIAARELLELMFPMLVADASITETHTYVDDAPIECAISVYACTRDRRVKADDVRAWERYTTGAFSYDELVADHNFLKTDPESMIEKVAKALSAVVV